MIDRMAEKGKGVLERTARFLFVESVDGVGALIAQWKIGVLVLQNPRVSCEQTLFGEVRES